MDSSGPTSPTVIGTDAVRSATYDFLSDSLSNYGPIAYRFRDVAILAEKRQFISSPPYVFNVTTEGVAARIL